MRTRCVLVLLCLLCAFALTGDAADQLRVTVTAYSSGRITASGLRVRPGHIALSRDVERALGVTFGQKVTLEDDSVKGQDLSVKEDGKPLKLHHVKLQTYTFTDRMPWYWKRRVDVYMASRRQAVVFGKQSSMLALASIREGDFPGKRQP